MPAPDRSGSEDRDLDPRAEWGPRCSRRVGWHRAPALCVPTFVFEELLCVGGHRRLELPTTRVPPPVIGARRHRPQASLRQTLFVLRRALPASARAALRSGRTTLALDRSRVWVDGPPRRSCSARNRPPGGHRWGPTFGGTDLVPWQVGHTRVSSQTLSSPPKRTGPSFFNMDRRLLRTIGGANGLTRRE